MLDKTHNGIAYHSELAGSNGSRFVLFPEPDHTEQDITEARKFIRQSFDVVHLRLATDDDWGDVYYGELFKEPAIKHLAWFEINIDMDDVRKERKKGTTATHFVETYVLPKVEATRQKNIDQYGEDKLNNI